jgi:S-adenosylmethionine:tRNA ribosyltransferase-isomerase
MNAESGAVPGYHYDLPEELIARTPAAERSASRLLRVKDRAVCGEMAFSGLVDELRSGDLLVVNDSRVLPARLECERKQTGGQVELLLVRPGEQGCWEALARPARRLRAGEVLKLRANPACRIQLKELLGDGRFLISTGSDNLTEVADQYGRMPLPPYIVKARRNDGHTINDADDAERYQTVYADQVGSVAAPTAGLHFDDELMQGLDAKGIAVARVCLHVGLGTFRNPDERDLREGRLHAETFVVDRDCWQRLEKTRTAGGRIIAVGTTSLRVLETVARLQLSGKGPDQLSWTEPSEGRAEFVGDADRLNGAWSVRGSTRLFLRPPEVIQSVDGLITNFHLPGSSLLMLLACAVGEHDWQTMYTEAIRRRLRFYSYGDASLIMPLAGRENVS